MSNSASETFHALHRANTPLHLHNVWDAASARIMQEAGASAIATSSAAVAWSLGYADGSHLPGHELVALVKRIVRVISIPLSIDIEDGYSSDPEQVSELVGNLIEAGVCGINLEDGRDAPEVLAVKIRIMKKRYGSSVFINARTDTYLQSLGDAATREQETVSRLKRYQDAGADGAFVPGMTDTAVASRLVRQIDLPLNLMVGADSPLVDELTRAGVRRFSAGPAPFFQAYQTLSSARQLDFETLNRWFES